MNYVTSKVAKRMDSFKVRGASDRKPRLLLPVSFGVSSTTLLHILDQHLQVQLERTKRTGYELFILFVDQSTVEGQGNTQDIVNVLEQKYSEHTFIKASLHDIFKFPINLSVLGQDQGIAQSERERPGSPVPASHAEKLREMLSSLPSPSSRADMTIVLRSQLVIAIAKENGCESILWGDSTTRLAERTLAETAKGRGYSLPWQTADGPSPHGISFNFPMRELLRKEIITYSNLTNPPLTTLIQELSSESSVSSKDTTIDDLMSQYFQSVETNYPSIVANVVRTTGRLTAPVATDTFSQCGICGLPVAPGSQGLHGWGGDQAPKLNGSPPTDSASTISTVLCYGCARTTLGSESQVAVS